MLQYNVNLEKTYTPKASGFSVFGGEVSNYLRTPVATKLEIINPNSFKRKKSMHLNYYEPHSKFKTKEVDMKSPYSEPEPLKIDHKHNDEADIKAELLGNDKVKVKEQPNTLYYEKKLKGKDASNLLITNWRNEYEAAHPGSKKFQPVDLAQLSREQLQDEIRRVNQEKAEKGKQSTATPVNEFEVPGADKSTKVTIQNKPGEPLIDIKSVANKKTAASSVPAIVPAKKKGIIEKTMDNEVKPEEEKAAEKLTKKLKELNENKKKREESLKTVEKVKRERVTETSKKQLNMTKAEVFKSQRERAEKMEKNYAAKLLSPEEIKDRSKLKTLKNNAKRYDAAQVIGALGRRAVESKKAKESVADQVKRRKAIKEFEEQNKRTTEKIEKAEEDRRIAVLEEAERLNAKIKLQELQKEYQRLSGKGLQGKSYWTPEVWESKLNELRKGGKK